MAELMRYEERYVGMTLEEVLAVDPMNEMLKQAFLTMVNLDGDVVNEAARLEDAARKSPAAKRDYRRWQRWAQRIGDDLEEIDFALRRAMCQRQIVLRLIVEGRIDPRKMTVRVPARTAAP